MNLTKIKEDLNLEIMKDKRLSLPNGIHLLNMFNKQFKIICKMGMITDLVEVSV